MRITTSVRTLGAALVLASVLGTMPTLGTASAADDAAAGQRARGDAVLVGPAKDPLGKPWSHWDMRWSKWFQQVPLKKNPAIDPDSPKNCHESGPIVLMGPTGTGDGCSIPAGKAVLFTALGWSCSTAEGNGRSWRQLRECTRRNWDVELSDVELRLVIDGVEVREPLRWRTESRRFTVDFPENNIWGVDEGRSRSLDRSVMWMLEPMESGRHIVRVTMLEDGTETAYRWKWKVA